MVREADYVLQMRQSKRGCLGRFHAICVAAMTDMPFSAWPANTWKNEGIMRDMGNQFNYHHNYKMAVTCVPMEVNPSVTEYAREAQQSVNNQPGG